MNHVKALETLIVLALASLVAGVWFDLRWLILLSMVFMATAVLSKKITFLIAGVWMGFSNYLGIVMNFIILFVLFSVILIPLSFFQRLSGKNQILKRGGDSSFFHKRAHLYNKKDIEHPW